MRDWRGSVLGVGDIVAYPAGIGSHGIEMVEAELVDIKEGPQHDCDSEACKGTLKVRPLRRSRSPMSGPPAEHATVTLRVMANVTLLRKGSQ